MLQAKKTQQTAFSLDMAVPAASSSDGDTVSLSSAATASLSSSQVRSSSGIPHYAGYTPQQDQLAAKVLSGLLPHLIASVNTVTPADKALVKQATGYDIDSDPLGLHAPQDASKLAGPINLDRSCGTLTGPITMSYLEGLAAQTEGTAVPLDVVMKAEKALE